MLKEGAGDCLALAAIEEPATEESAIEESWSVITGVLREGVVVVGDSLALVVTDTDDREADDICLAVESKRKYRHTE